MDWEDMLGSFQGRSYTDKYNSNGMGTMLGSLVSGIFGLIGNAIQNSYNVKQQQKQNEHNEQLVKMQNAAAAEESEKAYQRSTALNQVNNMRVAGMSEAGAINALNGGGSYQPAPVNVAQGQASQIDVTSAINAVQSMAQLNEQKRQFNESQKLERERINEQKRQFDKTHELESDKFTETSNQNAALRNLWHEQSEREKVAAKMEKLAYEIRNANKAEEIDSNKRKYIRDSAQWLLEEIKAKKAKIGWDNIDPETAVALADYQAKLELMLNFGDSKFQDLVAYLHDIIDSLPFM